MASGVDESAFLGSSVSEMPVSENDEKNAERKKVITDKRKVTYASIVPAIETLQVILANEIQKESNLNTIRERAQRRAKADGTTSREALSDELLYSAGRLDAFNSIEALFATAKQSLKGGSDE